MFALCDFKSATEIIAHRILYRERIEESFKSLLSET